MILSKNLANFERLTNYSCIFVLYVPSVEVGIDASKLYGKCFDPFRMNTYGNANEHEIISSLIQLSESTSLPPDHGKSTNSNANEQGKSETGVNSQEPACKKPFTEPDTLTKNKFNSTNSIHNILFSSKIENKPSSVSIFTQLSLSMNGLKHATRKDAGGVCGKQFSF